MAWNPFGVSFELEASGSNVTRKSATQFTVKVTASWQTYYDGAQTNYGMTASSGGGSVTLNPFGTKASSGTGSFTGTYSISGNGSATKEITVTFKNFNNDNGDSATTTVKFNVNVPAWTSYTVSYNANGGSGAPSNQTKWKDQSLTLSSTKPTRTGYTFSKWNTKSDGSGTSYSSGASYTANSAATLYAIWAENKLTVNYYSNYATSAFEDTLNAVGSDKNVMVWSYDFYYDNDYSTYGLANYSGSSGSVYMTRTGYTGTGKWGTSTSGGTLVDEDTGFATGQAVAKAFGKDISSGDASINVYAQWDENYLTINYHSNGANYCSYEGVEQTIPENDTVLTQNYYYDNVYSDGLYNIQNSSKLYLSRTGYTTTGNWGTSASGGTLIDQDTPFTTGQALAEVLGKSLESENTSIDLYAQWKPSGIVYVDDGTTLNKYLVYIDNGSSWDLYLPYVDNGTNWDIIS